MKALVKQDEVPWSMIRATQFHDLMEILLRIYSRRPGMTTIPFATTPEHRSGDITFDQYLAERYLLS